MTDSLKDQLLKLGFKAAPREERKLPRQEQRGHGPQRHAAGGKPQPGKQPPRDGRPQTRKGSEIDLAKAYALRSQKEKDERIAAEKQRQEEAARRREGKAKLIELLKTAARNDPAAEIARHFEYGGKIRRVYVTQEQLRALNAGELAVVQQAGRYHLVSPEHARQADAWLPGALALLVDPAAAASDAGYEDPKYQIPDDLVW